MKPCANPSIRTRLIASLLLALALILGYTAWKSYRVSLHESEEMFRARLASSARVLDALVTKSLVGATLAAPITISLPYELTEEAERAGTSHPYEAKIAFQIWHDDGKLLMHSASAPAAPLGPHQAGFSKQQVGDDLWQVFTLQSGNAWIQVAEKDEVIEEMAQDIGFSVMTPMLIGSLVILIVANLLVRFSLNPLTELATSIAQRTPETLTEIATDDIPEEITPVIGALNALLRMMQAALERERRFTDAAAHELRTPLAALKIHADNLLRSNTESQRQSSEKQLIKGIDRTLRLANQMLLLSRTQSDREPPKTLSLGQIFQEVVAQQEPLLAQKQQRCEIDNPIPDGEDLLFGQPIKLHQIIRNLLDNASRYGLADSVISGELRRDGGLLRLSISNDGPTIPVDMREKVFEPYTRLSGSGVEGNGLGLAIAREIAEQHQASIRIDTPASGAGTKVTIIFPAAAPTLATTPPTAPPAGHSRL